MFPWEHFAVGYVAYSLSARVLGYRAPSLGVLLAVLFGSQFPDLVDKPASWLFGVFPTGVSVAHSVFVAVTLVAVVVAVTKRVGRANVGAAFGVGYLLHLPADAVHRTIVRGLQPDFRVFLWPIASKQPSPPEGFLASVEFYLSNYPALLASPNTLRFIGFEVALLGTALLLWISDGAPGIPRARTRCEPA